MQYVLTLRKTILIFCFALITFGCAINEAQSSNVNNGLKAEAVPEGIMLTFDSIPPETTRIFLSFSHSGEIEWEMITSPHDIILTYADIRGSLLEQVKNSGEVIFPFVKAGQKYSIYAALQKDGFEDIASMHVWGCIPYSGIYFDKGVEINLNETHTGAALNAEPAFTAEVLYAPVKYSFSAVIDKAGPNDSIGFSAEETVQGSTWDFEPIMTDTLRTTDYLQNGDYPVYIRAYSKLIYNNIEWNVQIAKANEFTFSYSK
jgi:hypothetical protein